MRFANKTLHTTQPFKPFATQAFRKMPARKSGMHPAKKVLATFLVVVFGLIAVSVFLSADTGEGFHDILKMLFGFSLIGGFIYNMLKPPKASSSDDAFENQLEEWADDDWFESRRHH